MRWIGGFGLGFLGLSAAVTSGCGAQDPRDPVLIDCVSVDQQYEVEAIHRWDVGANLPWFGFPDESPRARVGVDDPGTDEVEFNPVIELVGNPPELGRQEPGRCGRLSSMVFRASGMTDWGAGFAEYETIQRSLTAEGWDGVSFWARTEVGTTHAFFLSVDNAHTDLVNGDDPEAEENKCVLLDEEQLTGAVPRQANDHIDPAQLCGNPFIQIVETTHNWHFYTLPWESFRQTPDVRRRPGGFDKRQQLVRFGIRFASESQAELWMDELGLYRHR